MPIARSHRARLGADGVSHFHRVARETVGACLIATEIAISRMVGRKSKTQQADRQ